MLGKLLAKGGNFKADHAKHYIVVHFNFFGK